ncbi:MAG: peptidoglycan-associated lipoprotein Pal [Desulfarculaceae bacterium]|nr:peptidoglycan-associated lipoprotein Pal [Desulfarculaceae bacterium]MCF8074273.1 peptidoglycan-associated lipoprotein Pal [Desulfarculaceae bacterium]MCF8102968.1 peptidoglycan-associated lipoprotein Pal [Desulfarculaceae bacterium]MCF8117099.1 peptidoglycan-associated lipoprotein Pal [Desulfarculaceae bacterium]
MKKFLVWILAAALMAGLAALPLGCAKEPVPSAGGAVSDQEKARLAAERERRLREQRLKEAQLKEQQAREGESKLRDIFVNTDIHFEYDRYDLTPEAKQILNEKSAYLQQHPSVKVIIEGHTDERGSNAYNMALGEKRAKAAEAYLGAMGISPQRMEAVSYGEERPLVMGQTEEAFAANRRVHFVIK